jgi:hypothetical protein
MVARCNADFNGGGSREICKDTNVTLRDGELR